MGKDKKRKYNRRLKKKDLQELQKKHKREQVKGKNGNFPHVCLNMIVKDEAHCIQETLESMVPYIDYYVVCDTGSTDNTKEIVTTFFEKEGIPGEIFDHKWINFDHNRTLALQACEDKSDYIFIMDADDVVMGNLILPELNKDKYNLMLGKYTQYPRPLLIKNDTEIGWSFQVPRHEALYNKKQFVTTGTITGDYYIDSRRLGARNKNPHKYRDDAICLQEYLDSKPEKRYIPRATFYLAQSLMDDHQYKKALKRYLERTTLGAYIGEIYFSFYKVGKIYEIFAKKKNKDMTVKIEKAYLAASRTNKQRAEPLYELTRYFRERGDLEKAYGYAKPASEMKQPDGLFITTDVYKYLCLLELLLIARDLGKIDEVREIEEELLKRNKEGLVPDDKIDYIEKATKSTKIIDMLLKRESNDKMREIFLEARKLEYSKAENDEDSGKNLKLAMEKYEQYGNNGNEINLIYYSYLQAANLAIKLKLDVEIIEKYFIASTLNNTRAEGYYYIAKYYHDEFDNHEKVVELATLGKQIPKPLSADKEEKSQNDDEKSDVLEENDKNSDTLEENDKNSDILEENDENSDALEENDEKSDVLEENVENSDALEENSEGFYFVDEDVYDFRLDFEIGVCGYYVGKYHEAVEACDRVIECKTTPEYLVKLTKQNRTWSAKVVESLNIADELALTDDSGDSSDDED